MDIKDYYFIKRGYCFLTLSVREPREPIHSHLTDPLSTNLSLNILGDFPANLHHQPSR